MATHATGVPVESFLEGVGDRRRDESQRLIALMRRISGENPYMWGPSIIGFGSEHYRYETGREGDMPSLAFSPRKASLTVYFNRGFEGFADDLAVLGKHRSSVSCLYITKLDDVDADVLRRMLERLWALGPGGADASASRRQDAGA